MSLLVSKLEAQVGNEWIDPNADYLKISVISDGFYRIFPSDIQAKGFDVNSIDPRSFKLLRRGKNHSISVVGEQDGAFTGSDYIEFYGFRNDAQDEKKLYLNDYQIHNHYSMYTDTAAYFLTWGGVVGTRIENITPVTQAANTNSVSVDTLDLKTNSYSSGIERVTEIFYSDADLGEGFVGSSFRNATKVSSVYNLNKQPISSSVSKLEILMVGRYEKSRFVDITISNGKESLKFTSNTFSSFNKELFVAELPAGFLTNTLTIDMISTSIDGTSDFLSNAYVKISYGTSTDFSSIKNNFFFNIEANKNISPLYPSSSYSVYLVSDSFNFQQITKPLLVSNDKLVTQKYLFRYSQLFMTPAKIEVANFELSTIDYDYLLVTHKSLMSGGEVFKEFKESELGGGRKVGLYDIEKLYNTYSYGDKNPLAIKRLVQGQLENGTPEALMILGKGLAPNYSYKSKFYRKENYSSALFQYFDFVPTFGYPGSDLCFAQGFGSEPTIPAFPVGRLTAGSNEMIIGYVNKLKEHAQLSPQEPWVKNFLHLSGGKTSSEASYFYSLIERYKQIAEGTLLGGNVTLFAKKTNLPVELLNVSELVNNGLSMITYIGHSAPNTIEIDLGDASNPTNGYRNKGKYPLLFINGCNSLDVFTNVTKTEDWVNTADKGAIAAFGHSSYAYSSSLDYYTKKFYEVAFQDTNFYGKSIGEIQLETIKRFSLGSEYSPVFYSHVQQWLLLGDPDVKLLMPKKADFSILKNQVNILPYFSNEKVTASVDSIYLSFTIQNRGLIYKDSIEVCIGRKFDNLSKSIEYEPFKIPAPANQKAFKFALYNQFANTKGANQFEINLDCSNAYDEYNEENNFFVYDFEMPSNGVNLVYPYPYAIIGDLDLSIAVESQDQSVKGVEYKLEIASDPYFSSIIKTISKTSDNLAKFSNLGLIALEDTTTFYWRARLLNTENSEWQSASFTYINDKTGWGQFEYGQFKENTFERIKDDSTQLVYDSISTTIKFSTVGANYAKDFVYNTSIIVNDRTIMEHLYHPGCNVAGFVLLPFSGSTMLSYKGKSKVAYSSCGLDPATTALFSGSNTSHQANMLSYLDSIPIGDYVLLLSTSNNTIQTLSQPLKDALHQFGCFTLDTLKNGNAYVFIGRKGNNLPILERISLDKTAKIEETFVLSDVTSLGQMTSTYVGPSNFWNNWSWSFLGEKEEKFTIDYLSNDASNYQDTLYKKEVDLVEASLVGNSDLIRLNSSFKDVKERSLSPLGHWAISYQIAPEGVVVPSITNQSQSEILSLYQGDKVNLSIAFVNVTPVDFDSVLVYVKFKSFDNGLEYMDSIMTNKLLGKDTLILDLKLETYSAFGDGQIIIQFNPKKQLEQNYNNNTFIKNIKFAKDIHPPLVELLLNGKIPLENAVTNSKPKIEATIIDENQKRIKSDTIGIEMFLYGPCLSSQACDSYKQIFFSENYVSWSNDNSLFKVNINFQDLASGQYKFEFFGVDAFGNINLKPAVITFEIEEMTSLSSFLPYPSPFSSEMRFAYQMKGSKTPDNLRVQILNTSGNLVYEVAKDQFKDLAPGNNLTEWTWDGKDRNGKILPNGIYLYKVYLTDSEINHLETDIDRHFKDGWGTIMIAR